MKTGAAFVGFLFSAGVGFAVGYAVGTGGDGADSRPSDGGGGGVAKALPAADGPTDSSIFRVPVGSAYQKGPDDALVTIVEFSDFQCPFCSRVNPTIKQIMSTYGKDVRIVFRHQPLPFHKDAPLASEYALAAGEQGKFWEAHDKFFANQKALKEDNLKSYAKELGLDQGKIDAFIKSGKGKKMIAEDQKVAQMIGATGTPAFFINGEKLSGAQPFPKFKEVIDKRMGIAKALLAKGTAKKDLYAKLVANGKTKADAPAKRPPPPPATRQKVELVDHSPRKGGKQPLVTIVEFSDYECPFCSRVNPTLAQVQKEYGDKVQIRFRNQPLSFHKRARPAAKAALAAGLQGKYWEMHDKLFANQKALQDADLEKYAKEIGLNMSQYKADMAGDKVEQMVKIDQTDAGKYGARGTPTLFVNGVPVRGAQPFANFKTVIDKELVIANKLLKEGVKKDKLYAEILKREGGKAAAPAAAAAKGPAKPVKVDIGRAPTYGPKNAPVKVVIYSDFECPFCGRVNPSIEQVKKEYGSKVQIAFKHYPLPFHKNAKPAAVASLAAHRQGKFWEMHDKLFENQKALQRADLVGYAKALGLDTGKFEKDLDDPTLMKWVETDTAEGAKIGVRGTPATFVNGVLVSGAQPYAKFKEAIDAALK